MQVKVTKAEGASKAIDDLYNIDPDPYSRRRSVETKWSKRQMGVYELSWDNDGWPVVDLDK